MHWNFLLAAAVAGAAWCAPVFAHDAESQFCEQALVQQGAVYQQFEDVDTMAGEIRARMAILPRQFIDENNLAVKILFPANLIQANSVKAWDSWHPSDTTTFFTLAKDLSVAKRKLIKLKMDSILWSQRFEAARNGDFSAVRNNPFLLLPNRIYAVNTDRGEKYKVRFSQKVIEDFFWEDIDNNIMASAEHAMEAVARGYQPPSSKGASGIATLPGAIGGEVVYKIMIVGNGIGANRIYGLARNGVIGFVTHEQASDHDCKYLRRVCDRAIKSYKLQDWN